jgi:dethiobiotin synthetase
VVKAGFEKMGAKVDYVTMEGSCGIICPIRFDKQQLWLENVIQNLNFSSIIVAAAGLGTIN